MSSLPTTSSPSVSAWQVITHFICFPSSAPSVSISSVFCRFIISVWTENKEMELLSWVMTSGIWSCESENWTAELPHLQTPCLLGRQRLCQTDLRAHPLNNLISFPSSTSSMLDSLICTVWQHGNEGPFFLPWFLNPSPLCPLFLLHTCPNHLDQASCWSRAQMNWKDHDRKAFVPN